MNIPVVYEDDWLQVLNKPSGLLTIPAPNKGKRSLLKILNEDLNKRNLGYRFYPCHRLDQNTSGLIIFAKTKAIQQKVMQGFRNKKIKKSYFAFVAGRLPREQGQIRNALCGRAALTRYQLLRRLKDFSAVKIQPITGRMNQIRIHFKQIGHPVLGEDRFAFRRDFKIKAKRLCLHAQELDFLHPVTGKRLQLRIKLPEYFDNFLKRG